MTNITVDKMPNIYRQEDGEDAAPAVGRSTNETSMNRTSIMLLCSTLLMSAIPAGADISWSWSYVTPTVVVSPTDSIEAMVQIVNDDSSSESLVLDIPFVFYIEPTWSLHYAVEIQPFHFMNISIAPGDSITTLFYTMAPTNPPLVGSIFTVDAAIGGRSSSGPVFPTQANPDFTISIIPEPTSAFLLVIGLLLLHLKERLSNMCRQ